MTMFRTTVLTALLTSAALASPALAAGTLRIGTQQEPTVLDPTSDATASISGMLAHNVYEALTTVDESGAVQPNLAKSWTISDDGLTYTFSLVEGAQFHDGTGFDAEDVKFSFDRAMAEDSVNPTKKIFEPIESVTVIDPLTVEMKLKRKDAFFLFNIAQGAASIVAPESAADDVTHPVGTGPFAFAGWTRGDRLTLEKFAGYRDADSVSLDKVEFRFISDPAAATAALMAEELDAFPGFPAPELLEQFEMDPRFKVVVGSTEGEVILALNNGKPPFNDLNARRGVSYAIDRNEIIEGAMYGRAVPIGSFYPPHGPAYVDLTGMYPHDTAKAKELFTESGLEGGEVTLRVPPFPYATRSAEIVQAELARAGVTVKVENVEWGFWIDEVYKKQNYDMTIIAHTSPNDLSNFARGPKYFYGYQSDAFDNLWDEIKTEADPAKRHELEKQAQTYLAENAVHAFLFQLPKLGVYRDGVDGFWASSPVLFQPLAGVSIQ
ncbi:ABC transporter substrate-binding protein [Pseudodonghicola flavimaris]|uniref:ABC transporter substrate-binding protein n=1 Tax=Pseudodonghicola flavimaris TaxID=3050036 RepID=A0ABT7EWM7_9RHOB|nr:ABC transporter substrate-binding protein [Pseudodonghicola flavimaris]MDK3016749.1 ABC transporter substrate-binding protein [Pseudodonghicola flavimaris]